MKMPMSNSIDNTSISDVPQHSAAQSPQWNCMQDLESKKTKEAEKKHLSSSSALVFLLGFFQGEFLKFI